MEVPKEEFVYIRSDITFCSIPTVVTTRSSFFMTVKLYEELILTDRSNRANWLMFFGYLKRQKHVLKRRVHLKNAMKWPNVLNSLIHYYCLYPSSLYIALAGRMKRRD
jgi:hypothetical protein